MKKLAGLFLAVILAGAVISCGTRKTETEKRTDIVIQNEYQEGSKTVLGNTFTYTPFDALKPMVVDGKTYENAIVSNDKSKTIEKWKNRNIIKTITIDKTKKTEKTDHTLLWIGLFFVFCLFVFLKSYLPRISR